MQSHALAKTEEDAYDRFEYWLSRSGLSSAPLCLADFHGPKPLEERLWVPPQGDVEEWVEGVGDGDCLAELSLAAGDGSIAVGGHHDTRSRNFGVSARIETALVSPDTASALVRALQTVNDSWSYKLPSAGHDLEINTPLYKLVGWLVDVEHESGIDERDPLRYEVPGVEYRPTNKVLTTLHLEFVYNDQARWIDISCGKAIFVYEAWGDNRGDEREERLRYDKTVRFTGWRLRVDKEALRSLLNEMGLDLIVEIAITRRNKGYDYSRYDKEAAKEARFDRVILLQRDETIEAAEGCLGTWTAPRT